MSEEPKILHDVKIMAVSFDTLCPHCGNGDGDGNHAASCPVPNPFRRMT